MVQEFNCEQMSVSGYKNHYKIVLSAGAKAKSVTNNLPILSVLACRTFSQDEAVRISEAARMIAF